MASDSNDDATRYTPRCMTNFQLECRQWLLFLCFPTGLFNLVLSCHQISLFMSASHCSLTNAAILIAADNGKYDICERCEELDLAIGMCSWCPSMRDDAFNELAGFGQSSLSDCSVKYKEQKILSCVRRRSHVNPNMNPSSTVNMSQLKTDVGQILEQSQSSVSTSLIGGIPIHSRMGNLLRTNMINCSVSNLPKLSNADFSGTQKVGFGLQNDNSTKAGTYSLPNLTSQSFTNHMHLEGPDQKNLPIDLKHGCDALASTDQNIDDDTASLQFSLMGPKLYVNTTLVDVGKKPVTGLRLYLDGKKSNCLAIHLQHLSSLPKTFQLQDEPNRNASKADYVYIFNRR